jgi:hypothetical protein
MIRTKYKESIMKSNAWKTVVYFYDIEDMKESETTTPIYTQYSVDYIKVYGFYWYARK